MSSIYKKGRDGYFYYQAYVFNKKTGKKNKRIFHSLSTKNKDEATQLKKEYDSKYYKKNYNGNIFLKVISLKIFKKIFLVLSIILLTVLTVDYFFKMTTLQTLLIEDNYRSKDLKNTSFGNEIKNDLDSNMDIKKEVKKPSAVTGKLKPLVLKVEIPNFRIVRLDSLSGLNKEAKIFVVVDSNSTDFQLKLLCNDLRERYETFSSIIICIYTNNDIGIKLANGRSDNLDLDDQKRAWLVMYSYNLVEGEYYDNLPSSYLGEI